MNIIFTSVADLVNPDTGNTYREDNNATHHNISLDSLVEVIPWDGGEYDGMRLYVVKHTRDCDGTPLYSLGKKGDYESSIYSSHFHGFAEDNLKVIKGEL